MGKTTTNINLAACLAKKGCRVLLLDTDPQGNTASGLGISKRDMTDSMYDVLIRDDYDPHDAIRQTIVEGMDLIPASVELAGAEVEMVRLDGRDRRLKNAVQMLGDEYDFIFIDCPPSLGLLTVNSLTAVDSVMIPIQCEFYALEGVSQLMSTIALVKRSMNPDLSIQGVLLSMFDGRTNLSIQVVEEVKKFFKSKVYSTVIPRNIRLAEAPGYGLPIIEYDERSLGAKAYMRLADEFLIQEGYEMENPDGLAEPIVRVERKQAYHGRWAERSDSGSAES